MAAKTWYVTNNSASVGSDLSASDPGAEAYRSPVTGWIVGTGSTNHSEWYNDVERASSTFTGTTVPDGTLDTTNGDFWVSPAPLTGDFASGNWNVHLGVRANTGGDTQDGRLRCRLFRGANQNGSSAVEITSAQQQGGLVTNLLTSATQVSTATFNPGAFSLNNEYVFVQAAWERTGAAGMTTYDVNARIGNASGNGSRVVTADFAIVVALGQPSETDTAQAMTRVKTSAVAQASETDTAQAMTRVKTMAVAQASETDTAESMTRIKTMAVAQASETDTSQPITRASPPQIIPLNQASETDTAQAVGRLKSLLLAQAVETDTAQAMIKPQIRMLSQAAETDTAQAVGRLKSLAVGQAAETDTAQALIKPQIRLLSQAVETDTAQAVGRLKSRLVAQAVETDTAQAFARSKVKALLQAVETDTAQAITAGNAIAVGQAAETDSAQPIGRHKLALLGLALEIDTAFAIGRVKAVLLGQALETDTALEIEFGGAYLPSPAGFVLKPGFSGALAVGAPSGRMRIAGADGDLTLTL